MMEVNFKTLHAQFAILRDFSFQKCKLIEVNENKSNPRLSFVAVCFSCAQVRMLLQRLSTYHCRQVCLDWTFEVKSFSATYNLKCLSLPTEGRKSFQKFPTECCKVCISRILFLSNEKFPNDLSSLLLLLVNFSLIKFPYLFSLLQFHI